MNLGLMHVIVSEILNKDFHVTLACRFLLLCVWCWSLGIHERATG